MSLLERIGQPLGGSGLPLVGNQLWTSDEYNVDLATPMRAASTYTQMWKSDAKVRSSGNNLLHALIAAEWRIDPAKDVPEGETHAEFVRSVLMPGEVYGFSGLSPWTQTLRNLAMAAFRGVTVLEKVWAFRPSDAKQVYAALELRRTDSLRRFDLTKTGPSQLESVTQFVQRRDGESGEVTLPVKRTPKCGGLVVFPFNQEGDNWWGESLLRPAHFNWRRKREILKFDAIIKERMGGIFWAQAREGATPTPEQIAAVKKILTNFRLYEKLGLYFPSTMELHVEFPSGEGADTIASVRYDDEQIEQTMMSQFQSLGTGQKGAYSVGDIQLEFMLLAYQAFAKWIEDCLSQQAIVELVDTNFGEQEKYPRIACENFLQMKPDRMAEVMEPLIRVGAIRIDKPLRNFWRKKFSLPEEDAATLEPVPSQPSPFGAGPAGGQNGPGGATPPRANGGDPRQSAGKISKAAPAPSDFGASWYPWYWRDSMPHEKYVAFDQMSRYLDEEPVRIWHRVVLPARKAMIQSISGQLARASDLAQARGDVTAPGEPKLVSDLSTALLAVYREGRRSTVEERARQLEGKPVAAMAKATDAGSASDTAEPTQAEETWVRRLAQGFATSMITGLVLRGVEAGQVSRDAGRSADRQQQDIATALGDLSEDVQVANLAGRVNRVFTNGRVEQGKTYQDELTSVFYSARMDSGTCGPCWAMDGQELDLDTWALQLPNPDCEGLDRCRCEPVFIFRPAAAYQEAA